MISSSQRPLPDNASERPQTYALDRARLLGPAVGGVSLHVLFNDDRRFPTGFLPTKPPPITFRGDSHPPLLRAQSAVVPSGVTKVDGATFIHFVQPLVLSNSPHRLALLGPRIYENLSVGAISEMTHVRIQTSDNPVSLVLG